MSPWAARRRSDESVQEGSGGAPAGPLQNHRAELGGMRTHPAELGTRATPLTAAGRRPPHTPTAPQP